MLILTTTGEKALSKSPHESDFIVMDFCSATSNKDNSHVYLSYWWQTVNIRSANPSVQRSTCSQHRSELLKGKTSTTEQIFQLDVFALLKTSVAFSNLNTDGLVYVYIFWFKSAFSGCKVL